MKNKLRIKNYKLRVKLLLLSAFCLLPSALTAQIEKKELKLTPEMEEMVITKIKNLPEESYSDYGIKDRSQLENLHTGKPIPQYMLVSEKLEYVHAWNVSRLLDNEPILLRFTNTWNVLVMSDGKSLLFGDINFSDFGGDPDIRFLENVNMIANFNHYKYKDSIIGAVVTPSPQGIDHLIIRKENKDIFVEIYDEVTGAYFKNEYNFSEFINHLKELNLRKQEAQMKYYDKIANNSELIMTPEITKMLNSGFFSRLKDWSDESLLRNFDITNRAQLENLYFGKPIPMYRIVNENLTFSGYWQVPVLSGGEPLLFTMVKLEDSGQYSWASSGGASTVKLIHNYEHKDLIIGFLEGLSISGRDYLIIRKDNQDIFVKMYDFDTREYLKKEYSFSEILNLLKQ